MKIVALIPIRIGSKRIKNKNFQIIDNKPLFKIALNAALNTKLISRVYVATDSNKIFNYHKKMKVIPRSKKSSSDKASTEIVINEFLKKYECDYLVLIQVTNIFLKKEYLEKSIKKIINNKKIDSLLSVVNSKFFMWERKNLFCKPINYDYKKRPRSQDIKKIQLIENGSFYIFKRKNFFKFKKRLHGNISFYEMPKKSIFEIDDLEDLKIAKKIYNL